MPKERIYGSLLGDTTMDVLVGWHNANSAHTKGDDGYGGSVTVSVVDPTADHPDTEAATSMMDRVAINRLIRALRRARDGAFGADA